MVIGFEVSVDQRGGLVRLMMNVLRGEHAGREHRETEKDDKKPGGHPHCFIIANNRAARSLGSPTGDSRRLGADCAIADQGWREGPSGKLRPGRQASRDGVSSDSPSGERYGKVIRISGNGMTRASGNRNQS
jgi:hypothetical protein